MMKKGISIWAFPAGTTLSDAFRMAKEAGFDGVEVALSEKGELTFDTTSEQLADIKADADRNGITLYSVATSVYWQYPFTSPDPKIMDTAMKYARCQINMAKALGCDSVLVVPGVVSGAGERFGDIPYDKAYDRALACMKGLAPLAEKAGIALGIENVWNKFLLSPLEMRDFVDASGHGAYAYFDVGNVLVSGYPEHWIDILGGRICKVHIKDFNRKIGNITGFVDLFAGDVNFAAVMAALRRAKYDDFITAEVSPYAAAPELLLRNVSAAMDKILSL